MSELRRRLLASHPEAQLTPLERLMLDTIVDGSLLETETRRNHLEAWRAAFDPNASLREELQLRLIGSGADQGALRFDLGDALLRPFQDTVSALSERDSVELEISGISEGSTVLHVRPVERTAADVNDVPVDSSAADAAVRETMRLFLELEREGDLRQFADALPSAVRFVAVLSKHALDLEMTWSAADGDVREIELTRRGREYMARMSEPSSAKTPVQVGGRVTELRVSGVARIKSGTRKNSPAYDVHFEPEQLVAMHLQLGDLVHFVAMRVTETDQMGRELSVRFEFMRVASSADSLDITVVEEVVGELPKSGE